MTEPTPQTDPDRPVTGEAGDADPVGTSADAHHDHHVAPAPAVRAQLSPTLSLLLGLGAATIAIGGLRSIGTIVAPTFLALTLLIAVYPVYRWVSRHVPKVVAGLVLIVLLYAIIAALFASLGIAVGRLIDVLPNYSAEFNDLVTNAEKMLADRGIDQTQIDEFWKNFDLKNLIGIGQAIAGYLSGMGSALLLILTVMIFLTMDALGFPRTLGAIHSYKPDVADALVDFGERVRKYWVVSTIFGAIVAVLDIIALQIIGVPLAFTFGLVAFVTNYIPNVGFVLGLVPPALLALLDGGVGPMVTVIIVFSVVNFVIQSILQPKFTGDAVGINATTSFLSLMFWAYVFGALGALLAIPLTLFVKSLLIDRDPRATWVGQFVTNSPKVAERAAPSP